jgi:Kef-type K+ transport system membrane component KefB
LASTTAHEHNAANITAAATRRGESIRTGFMLAQGGEFAFVLLSLASGLEVLPASLNQILIIVVVMSMALTPALAEVGKWIAKETDARWPEGGGLGGAAAAALPASTSASPADGELVGHLVAGV